MRDRVTIYRNTYTTSSTGQRSDDGSAVTVATLWAEIRQSRDDQDMVGNLNTIEEIWEFTVRNQNAHSITFQKKDYITFGSDDYQVIGISDQSKKNRFVTLKASRIL